MAKPRVLVLRAPGTNCDVETAFAFDLAGGLAERVHVNRLLEESSLMRNFQILCIPGGFSYGDDIAAGRILASQLQHHLRDAIQDFRVQNKLVLGICNGFQVLLKSGVLLPDDAQGMQATLAWNDSGRFEDRWVHSRTIGTKSVFLRGITKMYLPIAHAEGRFVTRDQNLLANLDRADQLVLRYCLADGGAAQGFPDNPNGSLLDVAGCCDESGLVLGLMPHPERHLDPTNHPAWTRQDTLPEFGDGYALFRNAVDFYC